MINLKEFVNKPCIVTFRGGGKFWTHIYDDKDGEYSIRIEDGWYQSHKADGKSTILGLNVNKDGTKTPVMATRHSDIVDIVVSELDEAERIAKEERWAEKKGVYGWNNYKAVINEEV